MYLNRVELIGFLGREPETKSTPNGKAVTSLSLATKTSWMKGDRAPGADRMAPHPSWGKLGEYAAGFTKGAHIRVEGELRSREYEADGGVKVRTYEIVANSILNLRAGQRNNTQETETEQAPAGTDPDSPF